MEVGSSSPDDWVQAHAAALFRIAASRLDAETAEDVVQETLLAALRSSHRFRGDSSEQTWLVGILKRKIADSFRNLRRRSRETSHDVVEEFFDERGRWLSPPVAMEFVAEDLLQREEFWNQVRACMESLPRRQASAFLSRVIEQEDPEISCNRMKISTTNLWVLVHRARLGLRACLERKWFMTGEPG